MKKLLSLALAATLLVGMLVMPASATVVSETDLAYATLESMGATDGSSLTSSLTRAQFCDMLVDIIQVSTTISATSARSPFSDVPATYWASTQINLVYQLGYLNGNGDGTFAPDRTITMGEAITAVLRVLGYSSSDIGYIWPADYITAGSSLGLLDGLSTSSSYALTYGDGVQLLANMLNLDTKSGQSYLDSLDVGTVSSSVIVSADGTSLTLYSSSGLSYYTQNCEISTSLIGTCLGTLLTDSNGYAVGFVPSDDIQTTVTVASVSASGITTSEGKSISIPSSATLLIGESKTTFGLGYYEVDNYPTAVLCYNSSGAVEYVLPQTQTVTSQSTVVGYYESAYPNTAQPETIQVTGATLTVSDDFSSSFAGIALGDKIAVTLNTDGEVISVSTSSSATSYTMVGILGNNSITLTCGVVLTGTITTSADVGQMVKVTCPSVGKITAYAAASSAPDALDLTTYTLGDYTLASDVQFYEAVGDSAVVRIYSSDFDVDVVSRSDIYYYHINQDGEVDVLLLYNVTGDLYTYGIFECSKITTKSSLSDYTNNYIAVTNSEGTSASAVCTAFTSYDGEPGALVLSADGSYIDGFALTSGGEVDRTAFDGVDSVVCNGVRFEISDDVQVYYEPTESWMTLENAKALSETLEVFYDFDAADGGQIHVIFAY